MERANSSGQPLLESQECRVSRENLSDLHVAAELYKLTKARKLIKRARVDVDTRDALGRTPLMLASKGKMIKLLIDSGADVHAKDNLGNSALRTIVNRDDVGEKTLQRLWKKIKKDCSNDKGKIARTLIDAEWPLSKVIPLKDCTLAIADLTRMMLQSGRAGDIDRTNALHVAVRNIDVEHVEMLLGYNANVNASDAHHRTPLSYAMRHSKLHCCNRTLGIVKMLLDRGAVLVSSNADNPPKAYNMLRYGNGELIKMLLLKGKLDLSATDVNNDTAVHALAANPNPGVIEQIHGRAFDLEARNDDSMTPLMVAAKRHVVQALEFLLDKGSNVEAEDDFGRTALHFAIDRLAASERERKECVRLLLERAAKLETRVTSTRYLIPTTIFGLLGKPRNFALNKLVLSHIVLREAQGISMGQSARKWCIPSADDCDLCEEQLSMEVYKSLSLFDLLTSATDKDFDRHLRDLEFAPKVNQFIELSTSFFYYNGLLQMRLDKAIRKRDAARIICRLMGTTYDNFPIIADDIISYMEQQDIKNLNAAFKIED